MFSCSGGAGWPLGIGEDGAGWSDMLLFRLGDVVAPG
jgi:hypothetical protein